MPRSRSPSPRQKRERSRSRTPPRRRSRSPVVDRYRRDDRSYDDSQRSSGRHYESERDRHSDGSSSRRHYDDNRGRSDHRQDYQRRDDDRNRSSWHDSWAGEKINTERNEEIAQHRRDREQRYEREGRGARDWARGHGEERLKQRDNMSNDAVMAKIWRRSPTPDPRWLDADADEVEGSKSSTRADDKRKRRSSSSRRHRSPSPSSSDRKKKHKKRKRHDDSESESENSEDESGASSSGSDSEEDRRRRRKHRRSRSSSHKSKRSRKHYYSSSESDSESSESDREADKKSRQHTSSSVDNDDNPWASKHGAGVVKSSLDADSKHVSYGGHLLPGEGTAMASFVQDNKRIPRRGEVGLSSDEIEKFEHLGYVMSGSRHRRMNAVRMRKENQVYTAEQKRIMSMLAEDEHAKRETEVMQHFKQLLDSQNGAGSSSSGK